METSFEVEIANPPESMEDTQLGRLSMFMEPVWRYEGQ